MLLFLMPFALRMNPVGGIHANTLWVGGIGQLQGTLRTAQVLGKICFKAVSDSVTSLRCSWRLHAVAAELRGRRRCVSHGGETGDYGGGPAGRRGAGEGARAQQDQLGMERAHQVRIAQGETPLEHMFISSALPQIVLSMTHILQR
jgi:hypothetical protein